MKCRICESNAAPIISFGKMPIANAFLTEQQFKSESFFELATAFCETCSMFQLIHQPDPSEMFHDQYAFFSSTSKKMAEHFAQMAAHYQNDFLKDPKNSFVVELGSNDGIMLKNFASQGIAHLGIEPSANVAKQAESQGVRSMVAFFGEPTAREVKQKFGLADIISAANVMCHIPDLNSVAKGVIALLKPDGIFVFEDPYLGDMVQKTSYDQIYDEHVYIFSCLSVQSAFGRHGLELFHVEPQKTHGGSMRYYLCKKGSRPIRESVTKQIDLEKKLGLNQLSAFKKFAQSCEHSKSEFVKLLKKLKQEGKKVVGYAATSKSTTVLNYCGIQADLIEYISDTTPLKQGKFSPGMHIPIKPYEHFKADKPDYAVLFGWNHAEEIMEKESTFTQSGSKWIVFVPEVKVLN